MRQRSIIIVCIKTENKLHGLKQETNSVNSQSSRSSKQSHPTKRPEQNVTQNEKLEAELAKLQIELQLHEKETYQMILKGKEDEYKRFLVMRDSLQLKKK